MDDAQEGEQRWEWIRTSMGRVMPGLVRAHRGGFSGMLVESLDGVGDPEHVRRVLRSLDVPLVDHPLPVLGADAAAEMDFDNNAIFPGYDAVWLVRDVSALRSPPPFNTYPSAEGAEWLPTLKGGGMRQLDSAEPVFDWMRDNSVVAGTASAYGLRIVEVGGRARPPDAAD